MRELRVLVYRLVFFELSQYLACQLATRQGVAYVHFERLPGITLMVGVWVGGVGGWSEG